MVDMRLRSWNSSIVTRLALRVPRHLPRQLTSHTTMPDPVIHWACCQCSQANSLRIELCQRCHRECDSCRRRDGRGCHKGSRVAARALDSHGAGALLYDVRFNDNIHIQLTIEIRMLLANELGGRLGCITWGWRGVWGRHTPPASLKPWKLLLCRAQLH
jgi:hypothetical protein